MKSIELTFSHGIIKSHISQIDNNHKSNINSSWQNDVVVIFYGWTVSTHVPYINHKTITVPQIKVGCSKMVLEHNNKVQQTTNKKSVFSSPKENQLQQKINRCIVILCKKKKYAFIKFPHLIQHHSCNMNRLHFLFCKHLLIKSTVHFKNVFNKPLQLCLACFLWFFYLNISEHSLFKVCIKFFVNEFSLNKHYKHWIIRRFTCSRDSKQVPHFNTTHQYFPSLNFEFVSCFIIGSLHTKKLVQ